MIIALATNVTYGLGIGVGFIGGLGTGFAYRDYREAVKQRKDRQEAASQQVK